MQRDLGSSKKTTVAPSDSNTSLELRDEIRALAQKYKVSSIQHQEYLPNDPGLEAKLQVLVDS